MSHCTRKFKLCGFSPMEWPVSFLINFILQRKDVHDFILLLPKRRTKQPSIGDNHVSCPPKEFKMLHLSSDVCKKYRAHIHVHEVEHETKKSQI